MSIEQKLAALQKMSDEAKEAERVAAMKAGMYLDAFKDFCVKDLGLPEANEKTGVAVHKLVLAGFNKGLIRES